jgi:AcrR family transcriptional regulator
VLAAAGSILFEGGFDALTVEGVAKRAGVSKATIYKWWPSKAAVAVDAFFDQVMPQVPDVDVGDVAEELARPARAQVALFRDTPAGAALASFVAAGRSDPAVAEAFRTRWLQPRRTQALLAVARAKERGQIRADVDGEVLLDLIFGPIYYRLMTGHAPLDDALVDVLVDAALHGVASR